MRRRLGRVPFCALSLFIVALLAPGATAADTVPEGGTPDQQTSRTHSHEGAFDRDFAVGAYYSRWVGEYDSGGLGFRLRFEPLALLGIETYAELLDVDVRGGSRWDLPAGFNLYVPLELVDGFRVRGLAGLCVMFSFASSDSLAGDDGEKVRVGVHVGGGLEVALGSQVSLFVDATYQAYFGDAPDDLNNWADTASGELARTDHLQIGAGIQVHL